MEVANYGAQTQNVQNKCYESVIVRSPTLTEVYIPNHQLEILD